MNKLLRIKLDKENLNDYVINNNIIDISFIGYTTVKKTDVNGKEYELLDKEMKYIYFDNIFGNNLFVSEDFLLYTLTQEYIGNIEDGSIYEHGYPESRLIPSTHEKDCQDALIDEVMITLESKIIAILESYF